MTRQQLMGEDFAPRVALDLIAASMKPLDMKAVVQAGEDLFALWGDTPMTGSIESATAVLLIIEHILKSYQESELK